MVAVAVVLSSHPGCAFLPSIAPISRAGLSVPIAQALPGRCRLPLRARAPLGRGVARMTAAVGAEVDPREFQAKSEVLAALAAVQDPTRGESVVSLRAVSNVQVCLGLFRAPPPSLLNTVLRAKRCRPLWWRV